MKHGTLAILLLSAIVAGPGAFAQQPHGGGPRDGFGADPVPGLVLELDPSGAVSLAQGDEAQVTLVLRNAGDAPLTLTVRAFVAGGSSFRDGEAGGGDANAPHANGTSDARPPSGDHSGSPGGFRDAGDVVVSLQATSGELAPGAEGTDAISITAAANATAEMRTLTIVVGEQGTDRASVVRTPLEVVAKETPPPTQEASDPIESSAADAGGSTPRQAVPFPTLAGLAAVAVAAAIRAASRRR